MPGNKKKILVVEDDITMREIVVAKISAAGYNVVEADNGKSAITTWEKEKPDLVLLDLMLPQMSGFDVLESIRKHTDPVVAATKVIILSNLWSKDDIERTKRLSIEQFMVKAYNTTEDILEQVNKIVG